jgi:uncharacterized protein YndB with AHSA1/START domain
MNTNDVRVTHRFSATPERVFDAWLDPEKARHFFFATPTGQMVRAEINARVGGKFVMVDRRDGEDIEHTGEYLEIDRPRLLVFKFAVPKYSPNVDRVTIEIVPLETGCELTLTQEMKPEFAEYKSRSEKGWKTILEALDAAISSDEN